MECNHHDEACQEYVRGPRANCAPHLFMICDPLCWPIPGLDRSALAEPDRDAASPGQQRARASFPARTAISEMFHCDYRDRDQFSFDSVSRSLWLFVHADADSDSSYLSVTVFFMSGLHNSFKIRRTEATDCKNKRGLG